MQAVELQRGIRPQPRQRAEPGLQVRHEPAARHGVTSSIATPRSTRTPTSATQRGAPLADFDRNQFGGMIGGPIRNDQTVLHGVLRGAASGQLPRRPRRRCRRCCSAQGDFSQTRAANGQPIVIYDPLTDAAEPERRGQRARSVRGTTGFRANRMDPVALNVLKLLSAAEPVAGDPVTGANNFYASGSAQVNDRQLRRAHRSQSRREPAGLRPLLLPPRRGRRAAALSSRSDTGVRGRPHDLNDHGHERRARLRRSR